MAEKGSSQSIVRKRGRPSKTPKQSSEFKQFLFLLVYLFSSSCSIQEVKFENNNHKFKQSWYKSSLNPLQLHCWARPGAGVRLCVPSTLRPPS